MSSTGPARRCLVLGSYPPVPGPASAATLAVVRSLWAEGAEVVVASPRPSAALEVITQVGAAAAARATELAAAHDCQELVLCLERGWPFLAYERQPRLGLWAPDLRTRAVRAWARSLANCERARLLVTGEVGLTPSLMACLTAEVELVLTTAEATAARLRAQGVPGVEILEPSPFPGTAVGPLEPGYLARAARARRLVGVAARWALGRHAPAVRARLARAMAVARAQAHNWRGRLDRSS